MYNNSKINSKKKKEYFKIFFIIENYEKNLKKDLTKYI